MKPFAFSVCVGILLLGPDLSAQPLAIGSQFRVNTYTTSLQRRVAVDGHNIGFVVVWAGAGATDAYGIFGQRFDTAGAVGSEFRVNAATTGTQSFPAVALAVSGAFVVVWASPDGDGDGISAQRYDSAGQAAGAEFRVNAYSSAVQSIPDVATNPNNGDFVIVWRREADGSAPDAIAAQRYSSAGTALGPNFRVNTYTTGSRTVPAVAMFKTGDFLVVWGGQGATDTSAILAQRYDSAGAPQGPEFRVNSYTTAEQANPDVAVDAAGVYLVVWEDRDQVYGQRLALDGSALGAEFRVDSATTFSQEDPSLAANASGSFVVSWRTAKYGTYGGHIDIDEILGRRVVQSETKGPQFLADSQTAGLTKFHPGVATFGARSFVVVWDSPNEGESGEVFARRYCFPKGDVNFDGTIDVLDIFYLINRLFAAGPAPLDSGDANGDTFTDVLDVFHLINFLFAGGPPPVCT